MGEMIRLDDVVVNYPVFFAPKGSQKFPNNPPQFSCSILLEQTSPYLQQLWTAIQNCKTANRASAIPEIKPLEKDPKARYSVRAASGATRPPGVVDASNQEISPMIGAREIYSGVICNVMIDVYFSKNNNRVCIGLLGVQKVADGERLDNTPDPGDLFEPIPVTGRPSQQGPSFPQQSPGFPPPFPGNNNPLG